MIRFLCFLAVIFIPALLSWWLFIPMTLLLVYLIKLPYEIIIAAAILDSVYYFGEGFFAENLLTLFSLLLIVLALFLSGRIHWRKII